MRILVLPLLVAALLVRPALAQDTNDSTAVPRWPVEIETDSGVLVIYTPQLESFTNNTLSGRAAFSFKYEGSTTPRYGTFWFNSRVDVDRDANVVTARDFSITRVRFPNVTADQQQQLESYVRQQIQGQDLTASVDRIVAMVAATETERQTASDIRATPPRIIVAAHPEVLLLYDGKPVLRQVTDVPYQRAVNTAMLVVKDTLSGIFYLCGGTFWYQARDALGPWEPADSLPSKLRELVPDTTDFDTPDGPPPAIIVDTLPTELIVTDGPPRFEAVQGTDLRYVTNTERDVLKDSRFYYVLLSGRWYAGPELTGPWHHVRPDSLPASFKRIYPNSPVGDALAFVPGTQQAEEAIADAMIPQTAAIRRDSAHLTVDYDGDPDFEAIPGTQVEWAYNSSTPVLRIGGIYYACDEAVWYVAHAPTGPWAVSDSVPTAVQSIPPSNPDYNVKYVQVYESTPEVVYTGYTTGYTGVYPYYGTVVWGTGYHYPPYVGAVYYPRPVTYGMAVTYNPYGGFAVGVGFTVGFLAAGAAFRPGYPGYYRRPPPFYGAGGYRPPPPRNGARAGARPSTGNIYNRPSNSARNAPRASTQPARGGNRAGGARPSTGGGARGPSAGGARGPSRPNNVFSAPNGNVMRQQGNSWQQRGANGWQPSGGAGSSMNRDASARSRGSSREAGRSSYGGSRGGGGRGGGGGRRR